jgi:uncharacterized membrane protein
MRQKQTKKQSIIEAVANTLFSSLVSFCASFIVYPLVGVEATIKDIGALTGIFTCISIIKNFLVRRFFETQTWRRLWRKRRS